MEGYIPSLFPLEQPSSFLPTLSPSPSLWICKTGERNKAQHVTISKPTVDKIKDDN